VSESAVPDEPEDEPPVASSTGVAALDTELETWSGFDRPRRCVELRAIIREEQTASPEVLMRECRRAHEESNRPLFNLAFEALSKIVTPLLLSQPRGLPQDEREEQAQQILIDLLLAIRKGKAEFAERRFAAFSKRRAISLYRARRARFEGSNQRLEPSISEPDPLEDMPARIPSVEARALLACAQDRLPQKQQDAFIQYHHFGMTQEEIAAHHEVSVRTVHTWLKKAEAAVGYTGEEHARS